MADCRVVARDKVLSGYPTENDKDWLLQYHHAGCNPKDEKGTGGICQALRPVALFIGESLTYQTHQTP